MLCVLNRLHLHRCEEMTWLVLTLLLGRDVVVDYGRLTDLATQRRLTLATFYGEEDMATLQNVLHRVPNIVPQLLNCASVAGDIDDTDDVTRDSVLGSICEDPSETENDAAATAAGVHVTIQPDKDGAYVNPAVADTENPDNVDVVIRSAESKNVSTYSKRLVRQDCTVIEEDESRSIKNADDGGLDSDKSSSRASLEDDTLSNCTLRTFLRMVSTQSMECVERSESRATPDRQHTLPEVIFCLLCHSLVLFVCFRGQCFDTVGWVAGRHPACKKWGMMEVGTGYSRWSGAQLDGQCVCLC